MIAGFTVLILALVGIARITTLVIRALARMHATIARRIRDRKRTPEATIDHEKLARAIVSEMARRVARERGKVQPVARS